MPHYAGTRGLRKKDKRPKKVKSGSNEKKAEEQKAKEPRFRQNQAVWPILSCNGKEKFGQEGVVIGTIDGRVWIKFRHLKRPVDYNPRSLSTKGP